MKKLLPILLLLVGAGGGVGAGLFLRPPPPEPMAEHGGSCAEGAEDCSTTEGGSDQETVTAAGENHGATPPSEIAGNTPPALEVSAEGETGEGNGDSEFVPLNRQMIVPIVSEDQVISLVVLSLSVEVAPGFGEAVGAREPKLRDAFLQVLFRHANTGGFSGDFTSGEKMADLRRALNAAAAQVLGPISIQVLVTDIMRQAI